MRKYPGKKAGWGKDVGMKQGLAPPHCGPNRARDDGFKARPFGSDKGRLTGGKPHAQGLGGKLSDEHVHGHEWSVDDGRLVGLEPHPTGHGKVTDKGPEGY